MANDERPNKLSPAALENMKRELFGIDGAAPQATSRFRPGQSGNPKGRPKRSQEPPRGVLPIHDALLREIDRTVSMREGGISKIISRRQALATAVVNGALKGVAPTQRLAFEILAIAEQQEAATIAREHEVFEDYCTRWNGLIAEAQRKGEPAPQPLPHPDDVVITPGQHVWFNGPATPEQLADCQRTAKVRDTFIMQDALDLKFGGDKPPRCALLAVRILNARLPKRLQLSERAIELRMLRDGAIPKRKLLKLLYRDWQALGFNKPRGWLSPPLDRLVPRLKFSVDLAACHSRSEINLEAMCRGEFDEAALALMARHGIVEDVPSDS